MNLDSFKMVFRSNKAYRFPGFSTSALCFKVSLKDSDKEMVGKERMLTSFNPGQLVSIYLNGVVYMYYLNQHYYDCASERHAQSFRQDKTFDPLRISRK